jgi:hypothetical protein
MNGQGNSILHRYPCPRPDRLATPTRASYFIALPSPRKGSKVSLFLKGPDFRHSPILRDGSGGGGFGLNVIGFAGALARSRNARAPADAFGDSAAIWLGGARGRISFEPLRWQSCASRRIQFLQWREIDETRRVAFLGVTRGVDEAR